MFGKKRKINRTDGGGIRGTDLCLMAFFLLLALGSFVWSVMGRGEGQTLQISYDGQVIVSEPLSRTLSRESSGDGRAARYCLLFYSEAGVSCEWYDAVPDPASEVPAGTGYNLLAVSGSGVFMEAADCRDQICVRHRLISGGGESIICLPHRLVVEITGGADAETLDGMTASGDASKIIRKEGRRGHEADG